VCVTRNPAVNLNTTTPGNPAPGIVGVEYSYTNCQGVGGAQGYMLAFQIPIDPQCAAMRSIWYDLNAGVVSGAPISFNRVSIATTGDTIGILEANQTTTSNMWTPVTFNYISEIPVTPDTNWITIEIYIGTSLYTYTNSTVTGLALDNLRYRCRIAGPWRHMEAESFSQSNTAVTRFETTDTTGGVEEIRNYGNGAWIKFPSQDLRAGIRRMRIRAELSNFATLRLRADSPTGTDLCGITLSGQTGYITSQPVLCNSTVTGYRTLYLVVTESWGNVNVNWFQIEVGQATPTPPPVCLVQFPSGTTPDRFNVYDQPRTDGNSNNIATVIAGENIPPAGIEVIGIYPNPQGELWYRLGAYRTSLTGGWTRVDAGIPALPDTPDCENVALVNRNGELTAAPSPTTNYEDICLFILDEAVQSYDLEGIRDRTNGGSPSTIEIPTNVPILLRRVHLNLQYVRVSYNNSAGVAQGQRWIKLTEANIPQFTTACVMTGQAGRIDEIVLPLCDVNQYLNCRPATAPVSPRIFNGQSSQVIADLDLGGPGTGAGPGCDNTDLLCYADPNDEETRPCKFYDPTDNRNCGIDIRTTSGIQDVFAYAGGIIVFYEGTFSYTLSLGILESVSANGDAARRYNYTHLSLSSTLLTTVDEYVATGTLLGVYGPYGAYGSVEHIDTIQIDLLLEQYSAPPWN